MADVDLLRRIEMLESTVESLRRLPGEMRQLGGRVDRLEWQFVQLRTEMRDEFSAIRRDLATKADLASLDSLRNELREDIAGAVRDLKRELQGDVAGAVRELSGAIWETRQELVTHMAQTRMLWEDVIARLKILGEGRT
jgi:hypothetical protein